MITITYSNFMAALALFTALCVAVGWLMKIIKAFKKPSDDINEKLNRDNKRIAVIEEQLEYLNKAQPMILRTLYVICDELKRDNDVEGKITKQQDDINAFLWER